MTFYDFHDKYLNVLEWEVFPVKLLLNVFDLICSLHVLRFSAPQILT